MCLIVCLLFHTQLDQLNVLAEGVKNQTENNNRNVYGNAPNDGKSEEDREAIYTELKKLLERRESLRCVLCLCVFMCVCLCVRLWFNAARYSTL